MSMFDKVSMAQAQAAKEALKKQLLGDFSKAAHLINGIGIGRVSTAEWCVKVNLERKPTDEEKKLLPDSYDGVAVKYEVVGKIRPRQP